MKKEKINSFFSKNYGKLLRKAGKLKGTLWKDKRDWLKEMDAEDVIAFYYMFCCRDIWAVKCIQDIEDKIYSNEFIQFLKYKVPLKAQEIYAIKFEQIDKEIEKFTGGKK